MSCSRFACLVAVLLCMLCTACFTGIESTPRIAKADRTLSPEQLMAAGLAPQAPAAWPQGKKWRVTDDRIAIIFTSASAKADALLGKDLAYVGRNNVATFSGTDAVEIVLTDNAGNLFYYRPDMAADDWAQTPSLPLPFTVELSAVATADSLMRGKTFYITTPLWYDEAGNTVNGLRHIPVHIDSVIPGNERYPLRVAFTPQGQGGELQRFIFMTFGTSSAATRNFDRLFAFENPRKSYPHITDETWQRIIHSRVAQGMTRDECRLALGAPDSIDRGTSLGYQVEGWNYDNGVYLFFEDGFLKRFRL